MRKLHVVGVSEDGGTLVLADAPDAPGAYTAPVEDRLRAALRRPVRRTTGAGRGSLTPREIQARLRAGAELADVAAEAGLPPERLEAYAAPVLSERARVLEDARAARMSRPQLGPSAAPLAVAVGQRLRALLGGQPEAVRWSASRAEDASWTVQFSYAADGATGTAAWRWDRSAHSLTPLNRAAAELGHVPRHAERPVPDAAPVGRGGGVTPAGDAAPRSADGAAARRADGADGRSADGADVPPAPATRRSGVPAPVAAVLAALRSPDPQAGVAADTGPVAASATPPPGDQAGGRATTGPQRADGTQGPSRVEDLQVDAAQAPTVAVLSPPAQPAVNEPAPRPAAAATAPAAAQAPPAQAPAAAGPPAAQAPATAVPAAQPLAAQAPAIAVPAAQPPPATAIAVPAAQPPPAPAIAVPAAQPPPAPAIAVPAVQPPAAQVPVAAEVDAPAPAPVAARTERPRPEPAPTSQPAQPREPVKPRGRTARRAAVPTWADVLLGTTPSDQREAQSPDPGAATG